MNWDNEGEERYSYVGRRPACGCIVAAVTDQADKITAEYVAKFIRDGLIIERVTSEHVRQNMRPCPHVSVQLPLSEVRP